MKIILTISLATVAGLTFLGGMTASAQALLSQAIHLHFPDRVNYMGMPIILNATATSGLPVTFSVKSGPGTLSGNILTPTAGGSITILADQAGDATYSAAREAGETILVFQGGQTLTPFESIPPQILGDAPFSIVLPTSDSGLPVTVSILSGPASISGNVVTVTGLGTIRLEATQAGTSLYTAAAPVDTSFTVSKFPVITSRTSVQAVVTEPFTYQITSDVPLDSYTLSGKLPAGLTFDSNTGLISGNPLQTGTFSLTVGATVPQGTGRIKISLTVIDNVPHLFVVNSAVGSVAEYTTSGVLINPTLITGLNQPGAIAISGSYLYLIESGVVGKYTTSGDTVDAALVSGPYPSNIAVCGSTLFVADSYHGTLGAYTTSGDTINASLVSGLQQSSGLAATQAHLFVSTVGDNQISEYSVEGARERTPLISNLGNPRSMVLSGAALYVVNHDIGTIGKYNTSGITNVAFITGLDRPEEIAALGDTLFVTGDNNAVAACSTFGSVLNPFLILGLHGPAGIAVDASLPQTITPHPALQATTYPHAPIPVSATASSGLPVTLSVVSGPAQISGGTLTLTGAGTVVIQAVQTGSSDYVPVTLTNSFKVTAAP